MREPVIGAPFNPHHDSCGFWPEDIVDRQTNLGDGPKRVYRKLRSHAGKNGHCFPFQETLAGELGKGERQIRRDIAQLEAVGLIASRTRDGRRSNTYDFLWHAMFERTLMTGQVTELSGQGCPVSEVLRTAIEPNLSARDRTDMTGVTGQGCPLDTFNESLQGKSKQQAAADFHVERNTHETIPRKPPGDPGRQGARPRESSPGSAVVRDDETINGFCEMRTLLAHNHVRVQSGQIQDLLGAGRTQGLTLDGVFAFVGDKLKQKRDRNDPVFSAQLLINAIRDEADVCRWAVTRQRCSSFFERPTTCLEAPFSVAELRDHLSDSAQRLRAITGYDDLAAELDLLAAGAEEQLRDLEALEHSLAELEKNMSTIAQSRQSEAAIMEIRKELNSQLDPYRGRMSQDQLAVLEHQCFERSLFESLGLPRLSLFYLRGSSRAAA
jgi:hypothetical protein